MTGVGCDFAGVVAGYLKESEAAGGCRIWLKFKPMQRNSEAGISCCS